MDPGSFVVFVVTGFVVVFSLGVATGWMARDMKAFSERMQKYIDQQKASEVPPDEE